MAVVRLVISTDGGEDDSLSLRIIEALGIPKTELQEISLGTAEHGLGGALS